MRTLRSPSQRGRREFPFRAQDKSLLGSSRVLEEDTIPDELMQSRQSALSSDGHKTSLSASGYGDEDWEEDMEEDDHGSKAVMEELGKSFAPSSLRSESHKQLNEDRSSAVADADEVGYDHILEDGKGGNGLWLMPGAAAAGHSPSMLPLAKAPLALPPMTDLPKKPLGSLPPLGTHWTLSHESLGGINDATVVHEGSRGSSAGGQVAVL